MTTIPPGDVQAPAAGALVWADFRGAEASEQSGIRPAIVISMTGYNRRSRRSIVCPITSNKTPYPTKVLLPDGLAVSGAVLCDQVRALERRDRGFRLVGQAPPDVLAEVRSRVLELMTDIPE